VFPVVQGEGAIGGHVFWSFVALPWQKRFDELIVPQRDMLPHQSHLLPDVQSFFSAKSTCLETAPNGALT
jgi:hypothetical protein